MKNEYLYISKLLQSRSAVLNKSTYYFYKNLVKTSLLSIAQSSWFQTFTWTYATLIQTSFNRNDLFDCYRSKSNKAPKINPSCFSLKFLILLEFILELASASQTDSFRLPKITHSELIKYWRALRWINLEITSMGTNNLAAGSPKNTRKWGKQNKTETVLPPLSLSLSHTTHAHTQAHNTRNVHTSSLFV